MRRRQQGGTILLIPVPEAEAAVAAATGRVGAQGGLPVHATVIYPFAPVRAVEANVRASLRDLLSGISGFPFVLSAVERFPGVLYLAPEPAEPFVALTKAVEARWPRYPPYEGAFDEVIPHVTVQEGSEPPGAVAAIERALPIEATAREVWLMAPVGEDEWSRVDRFPLAGNGSG
jgi:hypothetical protein